MEDTKTVLLYRVTLERKQEAAMKYTLEERLEIGRRVYDGEISRYEAAEQYGINDQTARNYMRMYRDANQFPPKQGKRAGSTLLFKDDRTGIEDLEAMTKEELIHELIKARITEARLKKGYEVKGDGTVVLYDSKNSLLGIPSFDKVILAFSNH